MHYIVYLSTSSKLYTQHELALLIAQSRLSNTKAGITGMLMYNQGTFFQTIEGEKADVMNLFEKINNDSRHHNIMKLKSGELSARNFPGMALGFSSSLNDDYASLQKYLKPGISELRNDKSFFNPALSLVRSFALENFLQLRFV